MVVGHGQLGAIHGPSLGPSSQSHFEYGKGACLQESAEFGQAMEQLLNFRRRLASCLSVQGVLLTGPTLTAKRPVSIDLRQSAASDLRALG